MYANRHNRVRNRAGHLPPGGALNVTALLIVAAVYATNSYILKPRLNDWFVHSYLNDLFAMPFILAYSNLLILLARRPDLAFVSPLPIVVLTIGCAAVWELWAPCVKPSAVFDGFDILAYAIGSCAYYLLTKSDCPNWRPSQRTASLNTSGEYRVYEVSCKLRGL